MSADPEPASEGPLPHFSPSELYGYLKPSRCGLRVWLKANGVEEAPRGAFGDLLIKQGIEHEARHLARFPGHVDIAELPRDEQDEATRAEVARGERVIYQGSLRAEIELGGRRIEITGHPDFLLPARRGYAIRDSKLARSVSQYIRLQLLTYGWLYEQTFGEPPVALQTHSGSGEIHDVPYDTDGVAELMELIAEYLDFREADAKPADQYIGASKCGGCGFREHCWPPAVERGDVGLLPWTDRGTISELHERGVHTVDALLEGFDVETLAEIERPWRGRRAPIGERAERILTSARAIQTGEPIRIKEPGLPDADTWVMFDLEGMPPRSDASEKIYIWGLQAFGERPGPFRAATAGFGYGGDRAGWLAFLEEAKRLFDELGDVPFVHWATYERVKIDLYIDRYGDPEAVAARVKDNLLDLLPITYESVAVPLSSYSLKDIETLTGYERQLEEYGGDWSMARYIEATESPDPAARQAIMDEILAYNREDLEATWAILEWLRER